MASVQVMVLNDWLSFTKVDVMHTVYLNQLTILHVEIGHVVGCCPVGILRLTLRQDMMGTA